MEEHLPGGFVTTVVRAGDTVRRPPSPNAAFVHDLTAGTHLAGPAEVVCHNDLSPRNSVYRDTGHGLRPFAFLDWDIAAPGARLRDRGAAADVRAAHTWVAANRDRLEAALA